MDSPKAGAVNLAELHRKQPAFRASMRAISRARGVARRSARAW